MHCSSSPMALWTLPWLRGPAASEWPNLEETFLASLTGLPLPARAALGLEDIDGGAGDDGDDADVDGGAGGAEVGSGATGSSSDSSSSSSSSGSSSVSSSSSPAAGSSCDGEAAGYVPDDILGQPVAVEKHKGKKDVGLRGPCPIHAGCKQFRTLRLDQDVFCKRAAADYLACWIHPAPVMCADAHHKWRPKRADVHAYLALYATI